MATTGGDGLLFLKGFAMKVDVPQSLDIDTVSEVFSSKKILDLTDSPIFVQKINSNKWNYFTNLLFVISYLIINLIISNCK